MPTSLILWDWNGTLLDDVALGVECLNRNLARFGYPQQYSLAQYREIFTFPVQDYYALAGFDFLRHPYEVLAKAYMDDYLPACESVALNQNATAILQAVQMLGIPQNILSACPQSALEHQVQARGIRPYFGELLGLGDIFAKSKVERGQQYLQSAGINPAQVVCVGDTLHDYEVSRALGARCVLFSGGHQSQHRLESAGVPVIDSLVTLTDYL